MFELEPNWWVLGIMAVTLASLHLAFPRMDMVIRRREALWMGIIGGVAAGYVALYLLPKIAGIAGALGRPSGRHHLATAGRCLSGDHECSRLGTILGRGLGLGCDARLITARAHQGNGNDECSQSGGAPRRRDRAARCADRVGLASGREHRRRHLSGERETAAILARRHAREKIA